MQDCQISHLIPILTLVVSEEQKREEAAEQRRQQIAALAYTWTTNQGCTKFRASLISLCILQMIGILWLNEEKLLIVLVAGLGEDINVKEVGIRVRKIRKIFR